MNYEQDIFYKPEPLIPRLEEFKKEAIEKSENIILEQKYKDNNEVYGRRESTDKSLEWILGKCQTAGDVRFIDNKKRPFKDEYLGIVFVHDWYFAWIEVPHKYLNYFVDKYKLETYEAYREK